MLPVEKDERYIRLVKLYNFKANQERHNYCTYTWIIFSLITSPLYNLSISMQCSVTPHLTIYGDVTKEQAKGYSLKLSDKVSNAVEKLGSLTAGRGKAATSAEIAVK